MQLFCSCMCIHFRLVLITMEEPMATDDVTTSMRMPAEWLSKADDLGKKLSGVTDYAAMLGSKPSRSAILRLALFRGLVDLEASVSSDGYGPWFELSDGIHARHGPGGLWFTRIYRQGAQFEVATNRGGLVHVEGRDTDLEAAKSRGDLAVRTLSAEGVRPAMFGAEPALATGGPKTEVLLRLEEDAAAIFHDFDDASEYVSGLMLRHEAEWSGAWEDLLREGWTRGEIEAAVTGLFEQHLVNDLKGWHHHAHVPDVLARSEAEFAAAGVSKERWKSRVSATREHDVADWLLVIAREITLGNTRAKMQIRQPALLSWTRRGVGEVVMVDIDADAPEKLSAKLRLDALVDRREAPVYVEHGPYLLDDGRLQVALGLTTPDTDRRRVAVLITKTLGLRSVGWLS
jgi:hypothetical protein